MNSIRRNIVFATEKNEISVICSSSFFLFRHQSMICSIINCKLRFTTEPGFDALQRVKEASPVFTSKDYKIPSPSLFLKLFPIITKVCAICVSSPWNWSYPDSILFQTATVTAKRDVLSTIRLRTEGIG